MLGRTLLRLVDLLPNPSVGIQRLIAVAVILTQGGIAITGAIVRVTASGLGCPTWPQCFPGSFVPVPHAEVPRIHQAVEFGNRMIAFAVVVAAALAVLAVTRARRRPEVLVYAWLMPVSTVVQAVIGGITVRTGLLWWTVAIHLLTSMTMVWLSVLLYVKIGEPDDGVDQPRVPTPLRVLTALSGVNLAAVLVTDTLVTAAGPHAGDRSPTRTVPRLKVQVDTLVHLHSSLLVAYLALIVGLGFGLLAVRAARPISCCGSACCWCCCARRPPSAPRSTTPGCPPRWWPCTWRGWPRAPRPPPRYGRRCDSAPRPSRSQADSTASANRRCAASRPGVSRCRPPSSGATRSSRTSRSPARSARANSNSGTPIPVWSAATASAAWPSSQDSNSGSAGEACDCAPPRKINDVSG
ncbi:cytochrome oxidase assembly protein [Mycobacterium lepraemurium]|nr:cytochrome oxidase assembly protein [Mycobacterium lepraemurium]